MEIRIEKQVVEVSGSGLLVTNDDTYLLIEDGGGKYTIINAEDLRNYSLEPMSKVDLLEHITNRWGETIEKFIPVDSLVLSVK